MASTSDIRAGGAFVEIYVQMSRLDKDLAEAGRKIQRWGASIGAVSARLLGAGAGILAPLTAAGNAFATAGEDLYRMSRDTGVAVESLSELQFALTQSGTNLGTFESALSDLNGRLRDVMGGNADLGMSFARLGLNVGQLARLGAEERIMAVVTALGRVQGPANQAARATEIFGGSGRELLQFIRQGPAGIEELRQRIRDLGGVMSGESAESAHRFRQAISALFSTSARLVQVIGEAMTPALQHAGGVLQSLVTHAIAFVQANPGLVTAAAAVGVGLVSLGVAGLALGGVLTGLGVIITTVGVVLGGIGAIFTALLSPIGLVLAAVVGLAVYFRNDLIGAFGSVGSALMSGDWARAAQIGWGMVQVVFHRATNWLLDIWDRMTTTISDSWDWLFTSLAITLTNFIASLPPSIQVGLGVVDAGSMVQAMRADLAQRQTERNEGLASRRLDREEALLRRQSELERMRGRNRNDQAEAQNPWLPAPNGAQNPWIPFLPQNQNDDIDTMRSRIDVAGTFSAAGLADITAGRLSQRQLSVMIQQLQALENIRDEIAEFEAAFV